jgi:hypothetical protein
MQNTIELGQFLTLVFQPDGFDAYDLSPLARTRTTNLARARVVSYRAPDWTLRFEGVVRMRRGE